MAKKAGNKDKTDVDTVQARGLLQGTEVFMDSDLPSASQQEGQADKVPETMDSPEGAQEEPGEFADAEVWQIQQPFPDPGTEVPETMDPPEEAQEGMMDAGVQQPPPRPEDGQREGRAGQPGRQHGTTFRITCRNRISKVIGGVSFLDGVGYTSDGFTASWFGNKDGYEVGKAGS